MGDEDIVKLFFNRDEEAIVVLETRYGNYFKSIADRILHGELKMLVLIMINIIGSEIGDNV